MFQHNVGNCFQLFLAEHQNPLGLQGDENNGFCFGVTAASTCAAVTLKSFSMVPRTITGGFGQSSPMHRSSPNTVRTQSLHRPDWAGAIITLAMLCLAPLLTTIFSALGHVVFFIVFGGQRLAQIPEATAGSRENFPSSIAFLAASQMWAGVLKSGSPRLRLITSMPRF